MNSLKKHIFTPPENLFGEPFRLFHGRGATVDGYEFLTIDWYPPVALVTLYETRDRQWLEQLNQLLQATLHDQLQGIVVQNRSQKDETSQQLFGRSPQELIITEAGLNYRIEPLAQQNIGFFPDMKPGRKLVREIATGKKVLNLFAYTCSLSVAAIAGGARQVINLDMNRNLLEWGKKNHRLNKQDLRNLSFLSHNLFKSFGRLRQLGPFELIVIDPPYQQGDSFKAERDWPKILRKLPQLLTTGGDIVAAVSAPELGREFLRGQFLETLPEAELASELTAGADFPEADPDKGLHIQHYRLQARVL